MKRHALSLLLVAVLGVLCYSNTFHAPFQFDDKMYIIDNPTIKNFEFIKHPSKARWIRQEDVVKRYLVTRQVAYISFWLNYRQGGLDVTGYHVFNLAVHIMNSALVYVFVVLLFGTPELSNFKVSKISGRAALFSALIFVAHPAQTEAVTYISQRFVTIAAFFSLLSLCTYARYRIKGGCVYFIISIISAALAMKSKETAFLLPPAIALFEFVFMSGELKGRLIRLSPLLLTMLIIPASYLGELGEVGRATRLQTDMSRPEYLFTQLRVLVSYIRTAFLPVNQSLDYSVQIYNSFFRLPVLASFFALSAMLLIAVVLLRNKRPEYRLFSFGIFWFFLWLSLESTVIPISELRCDYRMYLPLAGPILSAVSLFLFRSEKSVRMREGVVALLMVSLVLSAYTLKRNTVWQGELSLWMDAVKKSPLKARPHQGLGVAYDNLGMYEDAIKEYRRAIDMAPVYMGPLAIYNLGVIYDKQGRYEDAIKKYSKSIELDPRHASAYNNLGVIYESQGRYAEAEQNYMEAIDIDPYYVEPYNNLGIMYFNRGDLEGAERMYRKATELDPRHAEAYVNLGLLSSERGMYQEAISRYKTALDIDPESRDALVNLGSLYMQMGRREEAERAYVSALRLDPQDAMLHSNLGIIYYQEGRHEDALREFQAAVRLEPENEMLKKNLSLIEEVMGRR